MKIQSVARGLGWFSIGLGSAEVLAPGSIARFLGIPERTGLVRFFGFREIGTGLGLLTSRSKAPWLWGRVLGDALDVALLCSAWNAAPERRARVAGALGNVLGIAVFDAVAGARASR